MHTNKYQGYKAVDFLKDEDFLRWKIFQLEEDQTYWKNTMRAFPELNPLITHADELYKTQILLNDYSLTVKQIDDYHHIFQHQVKQ